MRSIVTLLAVLALAPQAALATITFSQLDDNVFSVSHRVKIIGSRAKATKMVYTKAASLCIAAGYSYYLVLNQESEAAQQDDSANASVRVKFFHQDADDRTGCEKTSDPTYVQEAREKLRKRGYSPPPMPEPGTAAPAVDAGAGATSLGGCTIEQIAAMARAGLPDDKIRAACE